MSLTTLTVVLDRDELLGAGNDLDINAAPYKVQAEGLQPGSVTFRRETVESPYVDGGIVSHFVKAMGQGQLVVYIDGTSQSVLQTNIQTLVDAFTQSTFTVTVTMDSAQYRWRCYAADYSLGWRQENFHANKVVCAFQYPRQPVPLLGPV